MATIVVQRVYATMGSLASVTLKLNGERIGKIKSGTTINVDAPIGVHQLRGHLFGQASNPLTVTLHNDDDEVVVELTT